MAIASTAPASHPPQYGLVKSFGPDGTSATAFSYPGPVAFDQGSDLLYVLDVAEGKMFKFDSDGNPVNWAGTASYIAGNEISGLTFSGEGERQVAVDSTTHRVYVTSENSIRAFESDGEPAEFTAGPGAGTSSIGGFGRLAGVATDPAGYLYASDLEAEAVKIFAPSGEQVTEFAGGSPANLAVDSNGAVYLNRREGNVLKYVPSTALPVSPTTTYTEAAEPVNPEESFSVAVDPATNDVYIVQTFLNPKVVVYDETGAFITSFAAGEIEVAEGIAIDGDATTVYVGDLSFSALPQVRVFEPIPDEPQPPAIEHLSVSAVDRSSAVLHARINPGFLDTKYWFEIGIEDCSVSVCTSIPLEPASAGAGHDGVWVSQAVKGLNPSTVYHYRVVAENSLGAISQGGTFRTQGTNLNFTLSDGRVWEMVSPPNKQGGKLDRLRFGQVQAAADGNGIAYVSFGPIELDPEGARFAEAASVLARREGTIWRSEDLTSANAKVTPLLFGNQGEFKLFTPDLSEAILEPRDGTALSPEASERAPYLRGNTRPPSYRPLVTGKEGFANVPAGTEFGGDPKTALSAVKIQTATPDLEHVVLRSSASLVTGAPPAPAVGVYRWNDGELQAVSVLPTAEGGAIVGGTAGSGEISLRNAISGDGSRVFWTTTGAKGLYMRDMGSEETIRIDVLQGGSDAGAVDPVFQGASSDGSVVYFTDSHQLTEGASPEGRDLYRCEIPLDAAGCSDLVDITAATADPGESAEVQGVVSGIDDDGSRLYFVAKGILDAEANGFGRVAEAGEPNLYLWEEGEGTRFIATLAAEDHPNWGMFPPGHVSLLSTAASPSGRYFSFMSERDLTDPHDPDALNLNLDTEEGVQQVFLYDALSERLMCISCAPTGAAPQGVPIDSQENDLVDPRSQWNGRRAAAVLPQPLVIDLRTTIYQPRAVLESGRVFFNSIDPLVPADSNAQWDAYQYEGLGVGDCQATSGNGAVARTAEGCVSLLSSGTGNSEAVFLDASISGNDSFFLTPARLTATDVDDEYDVYDARVGGMPVSPSPGSPACVGEACRIPSAPLPAVTPGSASFVGAGNPRAKTCPKGKRKVKRRGKERCVSRKGRNHQRRDGQRKGGAR